MLDLFRGDNTSSQGFKNNSFHRKVNPLVTGTAHTPKVKPMAEILH